MKFHSLDQYRQLYPRLSHSFEENNFFYIAHSLLHDLLPEHNLLGPSLVWVQHSYVPYGRREMVGLDYTSRSLQYHCLQVTDTWVVLQDWERCSWGNFIRSPSTIKPHSAVHLFVFFIFIFHHCCHRKIFGELHRWKQSSNGLLNLTLHVFYNNQCSRRINYHVINLHLVLLKLNIFVLFTRFFFSFSHSDL